MNSFAAFNPDRFVKQSPAEDRGSISRVAVMPDDWRQGIDLLRDAPCPQIASADRWAQVVSDAVRFAETRGVDAHEAGWSLGNVFGFDPDQTDNLVGLILDIRGGIVLQIEAEVAWIKHDRGCRFHYRRMPDNSPLLWQLSGWGKASRR